MFEMMLSVAMIVMACRSAVKEGSAMANKPMVSHAGAPRHSSAAIKAI